MDEKYYLPADKYMDRITWLDKKIDLGKKYTHPVQIGYIDKNRHGSRIYHPCGTSVTLGAMGGGWGAKTGLYMIDGRIRRLTPKETEKLQGFPPGWTEHGADGKPLADGHRYKMMGNAVCVPVVEYVLDLMEDAAF